MISPSAAWLVRIDPRPPSQADGGGLIELGRWLPERGRSLVAYRHDALLRSDRILLSQQGNLAAVFAGWLSNRDELQADLHPGVDDATLILSRYRAKGQGCLSDLLGRFAVIVFDADRDRIVATRDQMGTYPLFWAATGSTIRFSNTFDALLDQPSVSRELNRVALADDLRSRWPDREETCYAAVRRVPPGHTLVDTAGQRSCVRTWDPVPQEEGDWATAEEIEGFDQEYEAAVGRTLQLGPVGIWLSGGLDSVSVAAFVAGLSPGIGLPPPVALSLRFPDPGGDEHRIQQSVARQLSFPMVMHDLDEVIAPLGVLEAMVQLGETWPAPMCHPWLAAYLQLGAEGTRRGCATILTGHGGDEWLSVTPLLAADRFARGDLAGVVRLARVGHRSHQLTRAQLFRTYGWTCGLRPLLGRGVLGRFAPQLLAVRDRRRLAIDTPSWLAPDPELRRQIDARFAPRTAPQDFYRHELQESLDHPLVAMDFEEIYEAGRRIGAPIVSPLVDARLVELLCRIPPDILNGGGRSKGLVRSTLDRRFPELDFRRQKKVNALGTMARIVDDEGAKLWARMGSARSLAALGVVDQHVLEVEAERVFDAGDPVKTWRLFRVLPIETFARART